jgi:hypothetical protein
MKRSQCKQDGVSIASSLADWASPNVHHCHQKNVVLYWSAFEVDNTCLQKRTAKNTIKSKQDGVKNVPSLTKQVGDTNRSSLLVH